MTDILCGMAGAVLVLAAFFAGAYISGRHNAKRAAECATADDDAAEQERAELEKRRLQQEQQAYMQLLNFSAEQAYGVANMPGMHGNGVLRGDGEL